jgi:hypothetical protein
MNFEDASEIYSELNDTAFLKWQSLFDRAGVESRGTQKMMWVSKT